MHNRAKQTMLTLVIGLMLYGMANAQSFSNRVLAVSGNKTQVAQGYSLTYTVGEMTAVKSLQAQGSILTQGFLQPVFLVSGISNEQVRSLMKVYPSPVSSRLNVECDASDYTMVITSVDGKVLLEQESDSSNASIAVDHLAPGTYFIQVKDSRKRLIGVKQIIKI